MVPTPQVYPAPAQEPEIASPDGERVVISGMSGLYPQSHNVKELNEILYNKENAVSPQPRWKYNHPEAANFTGNVPDLERFDAQFFKVHYRLANSMDAMGRKVLEQSYQAIYDAGISPEHLNGKKVGVYIGSCFSETEKACFYVATSRTGFGIAGCSKTMFANRISYWLNAKGPSMAIDEACCSSLAALEQAYLDITRGECEAAIVGGANLCLHPQSSIHYARIMKVAPDGKTKSFDANADGCSRSEAINVLFLQKAKSAKRIYADVLHVKNEFVELMQGESGPKYGPYRDPEVLAKFIRQFYKDAKVSPDAVEYVEAFGSATPEADKAELDAIEDVFCKNRDDPLLVGSVMSNIGYCEAASGISAITKVLLAYQRGELAGNLHCENPRTDVPALRDGRMRIVNDHQKFSRSYAAVNGLSVTGVNAHVLLHGHYKPKDPNRYKSSIPYLVNISARQDTAVAKVLNDLKSRPIDPEEIALFHNIHETRISGHMGRGYTILSTDEEQKTVCLAEKNNYFDDMKRPLWFVYSGMGSQWAGMGTELMRIPVFAAAIERCRRVLEPKGVDIVHIITSPEKTIFDNILHSFVGIAAVQIGLTDVLTSIGIKPDMIIGHSVGELGCAYADGCLTAEEMILSAYSRGLVSVQTEFIRGSMAAVGVGYQQISKLVPPEIEVACHNGPESSTISGPADVMREFVATLTAQGIFAKEVPCSNIAYHSRYIAEAGPGLLKYLKEVIKDPKPRTERWLSTSVPEGRWNEPLAKTSSAEYHTNNLLNPVLFEETSRKIPATAVLVEIAPHGLLQAILKRSLPESCRHIPLTRRGHSDNVFMVLDAIGKLYMEGYNPKVQALYPQVEFPVSTGTPMLSHLVEWAHGEIWPLPLYMSAHRKTAATCKFVLSVHDEEHKYLQGHVIRGHNLYPFSAALIAAWDTLAMTLGMKKKEISVEFHDVQLFAQPTLHDQRQLRLMVALQRGTGRFEILDENRMVATGLIVPMSKDTVIAPVEPFKTNEATDLKSDDVYQMLYERNYVYSGEFRSIHKTDISMKQAQIVWNENWVTFLDGLIQFNVLRQDYDDVSYPQTVMKICIDVEKHLKSLEVVEDKAVVTANANAVDQYKSTRCGGVSIESIRFKNLAPLSNDIVALKSLKFVSRFQHNIKAASALQIYMQIVSENTTKDAIKVLRIVKRGDFPIVYDVEKTITDGFGTKCKVVYEEVLRDDVLSKRDSFMTEVDVILVQNLSVDESLCQLLYRLLPRDSFIINGGCTGEDRTRPSTLYNVISSHNANRTKLELIRWRPTQSTLASTIVTVRTRSDIAMLKTTQATLPPKHRLVIVSSYPAPAGLKDLVQQWRKESDKNQVYLVMVSDRDNLEQLPELDLAFNVLQNGVWGGEYYVPCEETTQVRRGVTLRSGRIGDLDSLHWVEAVEPTGAGIPVTVHYVGLSDIDAKTASGVIPLSLDNEAESTYGMSFSGYTDNGIRVMGIVPTGAACSRVRVAPELIWPVPDHWSLEDAATVPVAYMQAYYCLSMKVKYIRGFRVLVHGGAGALGQAVISVALATGCEVFTTVSDIRKKRFLMRLFPELKEDHIGNSRDHTFGDMVLSQTNGNGCNIVICCVKGELKNVSLKCLGHCSIFLDVVQISSREMYSFGMSNLVAERNYLKVDFCSIFGNTEELKHVQSQIWEGISKGYVRPLSRVTYAPHDTPRAFRLLAASRHRGRVLIQMPDTSAQAPKPVVRPRMSCSSDLCQLVICNEGTFGLLLAERLIKRGAKKLLLHFNKIPNQLHLNMKSWKDQGIKVQVSTEDLSSNKGVVTLLQDGITLGPIEGIHVVATHVVEDIESVTAVLGSLDAASRKLCPALRYFSVIAAGNLVGHQISYSRVRDGLPAKTINISSLKVTDHIPAKQVLSYRAAVEAVERALCSETGAAAVAAHAQGEASAPLLEQIAQVADIEIPEDIMDDATLLDLGIELAKVPAVVSFLTDIHNVSYSEDVIPTLTVQQIRELETTINDLGFKDVKGLSTFYNYVDTDELLASTETVFLPTLTNSATMRDDEFDTSQRYLCVVPGLEGHHERFRMLCERLKLPALTLQPGLDHNHETFEERAKRYAMFLLKRTKLHDKFYLLGYETGVNIALEMAAILEEQGVTGTVFLLGGTPEEVQALLNDRVSQFESEDALNEGVVNHIRSLTSRATHSAQYESSLIKSAQERLKRALLPTPKVKALRSKIILLRASDVIPCKTSIDSKMVVHNLRAPLAFAASDLRCAGIINSNLDEEVLLAFEEKNLCDTYLLNADTFMTSNLKES